LAWPTLPALDAFTLECRMAPVVTSAGVRMPGIIYGTAWKKADTQRLVALAIQQGFRGIDTACQPKHYNEPGVGTAVAAAINAGLPRGDLYVQTKFTSVSGHDPRRIPYDPTAPLGQQVTQSCAQSLRNLQTDYLDCLVLHSPLSTREETQTVWQAIEALVDAGRIRQPGISNCYSLAELEALYRSVRIRPAVLQNRFHAETGYDREIRSFCMDHGIAYQSFWTLTANPLILASATITDLASKYRRTPVQILFRYLTHTGVVPLTGTKSELHMREDLSIFDFELTVPDRKAVEDLFGA
jgi:diketogulonate reductase-like aldo/keto reductase